MILIADSGSTKTDWCLVENGKNILRFQTRGTNPFFQTEEEILEEIETGLLPGLKGVEPSSVHFYGAGCAFPEKNEIIRRAVSRQLPVLCVATVPGSLAFWERGLTPASMTERK